MIWMDRERGSHKSEHIKQDLTLFLTIRGIFLDTRSVVAKNLAETILR